MQLSPAVTAPEAQQWREEHPWAPLSAWNPGVQTPAQSLLLYSQRGRKKSQCETSEYKMEKNSGFIYYEKGFKTSSWYRSNTIRYPATHSAVHMCQAQKCWDLLFRIKFLVTLVCQYILTILQVSLKLTNLLSQFKCKTWLTAGWKPK